MVSILCARTLSILSLVLLVSLLVIIYDLAFEGVIFEKRHSNVSASIFEYFVDFNLNDKQIDSVEYFPKILAREKPAVSLEL